MSNTWSPKRSWVLLKGNRKSTWEEVESSFPLYRLSRHFKKIIGKRQFKSTKPATRSDVSSGSARPRPCFCPGEEEVVRSPPGSGRRAQEGPGGSGVQGHPRCGKRGPQVSAWARRPDFTLALRPVIYMMNP